MTLGLAHEISLALTTSLAFLVALLGGGLSPFAWAVLLAPVLSLMMKLRDRAAPATSGTVIALASLGLGVATLVQRGVESAVLAGGYALMGLLVARLLTRTTLAHDLQALLLSLLLLVAAAVLNVKLSYAPAFVAYGISVVWALITRELLRGVERSSAGDERRVAALRARTDVVTKSFLVTTSTVAVAILLATSGIFVLFPRVGFQSLGFQGGDSNRLPGSVSLRGLPRSGIASGDVVARVRGVSYDAFLRGLYLRGAVYEVVDEQGFRRSEPPPRLHPGALALADAPEDASYEVYLSPGAGTTLLTLGRVRGAYPVSGGRTNPNDRLSLSGTDERTELHASDVVRTALRYRVQGGVAAVASVAREGRQRAELPPDGDAAVFFALPDELDPRVKALVDEVTAGVTEPTAIAARLRSFLLTRFDYSLEQPNAEKQRPLTAFLLEDRRGHCEYFAAAYALMLRTKGIGARVIGGYQGGSWDPGDDVIVFTGKNAHAWVEWFLPGAGWIVDDPTPLAQALRPQLTGLAAWLERVQRFWDDSVLDYALGDQLALARRLQKAIASSDDDVTPDERNRRLLLYALAGLVLVGGGVALYRRRRRGRRAQRAQTPEDVLAASLLAVLSRYRGAPVSDVETLREAVGATSWRSDEERAVVAAALALYERGRFASRSLDGLAVARATEALAALSPSEDAGSFPPRRGSLSGSA